MENYYTAKVSPQTASEITAILKEQIPVTNFDSADQLKECLCHICRLGLINVAQLAFLFDLAET